jgi:hypothetical protein
MLGVVVSERRTPEKIKSNRAEKVNKVHGNPSDQSFALMWMAMAFLLPTL